MPSRTEYRAAVSPGVDEARAAIAERYPAFRSFDPVCSNTPFRLDTKLARFNGVTVSTSRHTGYRIDLEQTSGVYFTIAETCVASVSNGSSEIIKRPMRTGALIGTGFRADDPAGFVGSTLMVPRELLASDAAEWFETSHVPADVFEEVAIDKGLGLRLASLLAMTALQLEDDPNEFCCSPDTPLLFEAMRAQLATLWLNGRAGKTACGPRHLKRATAFLEERYREPVTVGEAALAAGCSPRALQLAFADAYGFGPAGYLRRVRMAKARERLLRPNPGDTVTSIVYGCGFGHLGRFSRHYRERFNESPCETLKRSRIYLFVD